MATTITPSILMRKAIVGSSDVGASSTACLNAAISSCVAGRGRRSASSAQIGIPLEVSALRSDLRSASRQIPLASARPIASKTSVGLPSISRVKICSDWGSSGCRDGLRTDMKLLLKREATPCERSGFPRRGNLSNQQIQTDVIPLHLQPQIYKPADGFGAAGQVDLRAAPVVQLLGHV